MSASISALITPAQVLALQGQGRHVVFLDVRFAPGKTDGRQDYERQHIAGAHYVDLGTQLQGQGGGVAGARPLPTVEQLQHEIVRWGIHPDSVVVAYSDKTHAAAARAWFVLAWAGHGQVKFLDGGLNAWIEAGGQTSADYPTEGDGTFAITSTGHLPTASADDIGGFISHGTPVFDAREPENYAKGHVPGALSLWSKNLLANDGRVLPREDIVSLFASKGVKAGDTVGVYCGGGVSAALESLILREIGVEARHFVGSFTAWAADPERPVAKSQ